MKIYFQVISNQIKSCQTGIILNIQFGSQNLQYCFNCPDGFQRIALSQKLSFNKTICTFISNMKPNYFGGFSGFYLSSGQGIDWNNKDIIDKFGITIIGPTGMVKQFENQISFMGLMQYLRFIECNQSFAQQQIQYFGLSKDTIINSPDILGMSNLSKKKYFSNQQELEDYDIIKKSHKQKVFYQENENFYYQDDYLKVNLFDIVNDKGEICKSFICQFNQGQRKFITQKAKEIKGLIPKVHYKLLVMGQDVKLQDGSIVTADDVCEPLPPTQLIAFIFMPDESYCQNFINNFDNIYLKQLADDLIDKNQKNLLAIYHSIPQSVFLNQQYQEILNKNFKDAEHILDFKENVDPIINNPKAFQNLQKLKLICPLMFPTQQGNEIYKKQYILNQFENQKKQLEFIKQQSKLQLKYSYQGMIYNILPFKQFNDDLQQQLINQYNQYDNELEQFKQKIDEIKQQYYQQNNQFEQLDKINLQRSLAFNEKETQILFLGTISMKPMILRGPSAIMLIKENAVILMDCAEGSYNQIQDHFGYQQNIVNKMILKIRFVFLTHIHGDHTFGILKILHERDQLIQQFDSDNKIYVVTPSPMINWINDFVNQQLKYKDMVVIVPAHNLNPEMNYYYQNDEEEEINQAVNACYDANDQRIKVNICEKQSKQIIDQKIQDFIPLCNKSQELTQKLQDIMKFDKIISVEVDHCKQSYACLLVQQDQSKIIYSGDTRPCQNFINYAQNSLFVIHEATLASDLEQDAICKKHTTTKEALDLIREIKPWRSILTHFSPRYDKVSEILPENMELKCMIAFDHLRLNLSDFEWAYNYLPLFKDTLIFNQESQSQSEN